VTGQLTHQSLVAPHRFLRFLVTGKVNVGVTRRTTVLVVLDADVDAHQRQEELAYTQSIAQSLLVVTSIHT